MPHDHDHLSTARQCARLQDQLREAEVSAASPKGIVKVTCNGLADEAEMVIIPGAKQRYQADSMAGLITGAFVAADRAVEALQQHIVGGITIEGRPLAAGRAHRDSAAETVSSCFGTPLPSPGIEAAP